MKCKLTLVLIFTVSTVLAQTKEYKVNFPEDLASLNYTALTTLNTISAISKIESFTELKIVAVTNDCENMEKARRLSMRRAANIQAYLNAIECNTKNIEIIEAFQPLESSSNYASVSIKF